MTQIAKELKLDYKNVYELLVPDGNPSLKTVFKLLDLWGYGLRSNSKARNGKNGDCNPSL